MAWRSPPPLRNGAAVSASSSQNLPPNYEISDDLNRQHVQCLEKKYGGRLRAHSAATRIQRAYRLYSLQKHFKSTFARDPQNGHSNRGGLEGRTGLSQSMTRFVRFLDVLGFSVDLQVPTNELAARPAVRRAERPLDAPLAAQELHAVRRARGRGPRVQRDALAAPEPTARVRAPSAASTPRSVGGTSPAVWVQSRCVATATIGNSAASIPFATPSTSSSSLTPNESPAHRSVYQTHSLPRMEGRNSSSSASSDIPNFVQMDSMMLVRGTSRVRDHTEAFSPLHYPSADHRLTHSATTSSTSTANENESNGVPASEVVEPTSVEQERRRMYRVALNTFFNKKPDRGLRLLVDWRFVDEHPESVAKFLRTRRGISKKMIGEFLGTLRSDYHAEVLAAVLKDVPMHELGIDEALRSMIHAFQLPSEAQRIDHVMQVFRVDQTITGRDKPRLVEQHRRLICYCRVNQIASPSKRQSVNAHQRDIFLFNDLLLVTKCANTRKDAPQYTLRLWTPLLGLRIDECAIDGYECAMRVILPNGSHLFLNAKNPTDRRRFIADVKESALECEEMERLRIGFELRRRADAFPRGDEKADGEEVAAEKLP
ncbi:SEC7 domain-containing protein [Aphelenchoides fujianensis]|nr:SEC7 domain-containing protein [Aphelenchoides fujianensis]